YLSTRNWTTAEAVEATLEHTPKYERLAQEIEERVARGSSIETVARVLGVGWQTAREALEFARSGRRPVTKPSGKRGNWQGPPKYVVLADEAVRLRDQEQLSFERIAKRLKVAKRTATRAYDHGRPAAVREAAEEGKPPRRGRYSHLGRAAYER